jgi:hypothetical protein
VPQEPMLYVNSAQVYDNLIFEHSRDCLLLRQQRRLQTACSVYFATTTTTSEQSSLDLGYSNAIGNPVYLFLSLIFFYALFFLSVIYDSFLYACSEIVLFIMIDYIYVIMFKPSIFWIKIMWKLLNFLTTRSSRNLKIRHPIQHPRKIRHPI